jgi:hypothetical protein
MKLRLLGEGFASCRLGISTSPRLARIGGTCKRVGIRTASACGIVRRLWYRRNKMLRVPTIHLRDSRFDDEIARLDPHRDAHRVVEILANHVFPIEFFLATELGQFRTFSIPSISKVLAQTGEYERNGVRRVDDTRAYLVEILSSGPGTPDGDAMIDRLHRIHSLYRIRNDDYIYTLSVFVVDPVEFIDRHGWRATTAGERHALFTLYRRLAERMRVRDLPDSYDAIARWRREYEAREQRYTSEGEAVARGLLKALTASVPAISAARLEEIVTCFITERTRTALGLRPPPPLMRDVVVRTLTTRKTLMRRFDPWQTSPFWKSAFFQRYPSYPNGYDRLRLGPERVLATLRRMDEAATSSTAPG